MPKEYDEVQGIYYAWCKAHKSVWADDPDEENGACEYAYIIKSSGVVYTPEPCERGLAIVTVVE